MANYRVVLRELSTGEEVVRAVTVPYENAALCAALGGYSWPYRRRDVEHARRMAGVYSTKPPDQRYQLISMECIDDAFKTIRFRRTSPVAKGPDGNMEKYFVERAEP